MTPAALAALHQRCFTMPPPWSASDFAELLGDPRICLATRQQDTKILAFAVLRVVLDEAELLTLATSPESRRAGLARAVLTQGLGMAQARGAQVCFLEVAHDNAAAIALYAGFGFVRVGQRPGYYRAPGQPPRDALVFRAELNRSLAAAPA